MNTPDDHDTRKQAIESAMISNAEDKAQVAAFGKAAYEAFGNTFKWDQLTPEDQCHWVRVSQSVLDEARRCGWL